MIGTFNGSGLPVALPGCYKRGIVSNGGGSLPMRTIALSVACVLLGSLAFAQPPKPAQPVNLTPTLDPKNNRLDHHLLQWEQRMSGVESILCQLQREDKDKTSGFTKTFEGEARYLKPNFAALRMIQKDNPKNYELYVSTGQYLYEYRPAQKTLRIHEIPAPEKGGNLQQNNFLSFVFGMGASDAKRRYDLTLTKDLDDKNPHYIYIEVRPKFESDKREFTRAQLVLFSTTMLPRRLWFEHPNGDQVTWDIKQIDTSTKLKPVDFTPPDPPEGWQRVRVPKMDSPVQPASGSGTPRLIRPASDK